MKLPLPENRIAVFDAPIATRWGDQDPYNHINNTIYLRYFEEARVRWFTALGRDLHENGQGPVVANIFCNFRRQLQYPADLCVRLSVSEPGRSSMDVWMEIERTDEPDVVYADGGATMVWIDLQSGRPVPLPAWIRELAKVSAA